MHPSFGFGGSCLPKELTTLARAGRDRGLPMHVTTAASAANLAAQDRFATRVAERGRRARRAGRSGCWGSPSRPAPTTSATRRPSASPSGSSAAAQRSAATTRRPGANAAARVAGARGRGRPGRGRDRAPTRRHRHGVAGVPRPAVARLGRMPAPTARHRRPPAARRRRAAGRGLPGRPARGWPRTSRRPQSAGTLADA